MRLIGRPRVFRLLALGVLVATTLSLTGIIAQVHLLGHNARMDTDHCWICIGLLTSLHVVITGPAVFIVFVYLQLLHIVAPDYIPCGQHRTEGLGPRSPPSI